MVAISVDQEGLKDPRKAGLQSTIEALEKLNHGLRELNNRIESFSEIRIGSIKEPSKLENTDPEEPSALMDKIRIRIAVLSRNIDRAHNMFERLESEL